MSDATDDAAEWLKNEAVNKLRDQQDAILARLPISRLERYYIVTVVMWLFVMGLVCVLMLFELANWVLSWNWNLT